LHLFLGFLSLRVLGLSRRSVVVVFGTAAVT
jgi:hypothetical protein